MTLTVSPRDRFAAHDRLTVLDGLGKRSIGEARALRSAIYAEAFPGSYPAELVAHAVRILAGFVSVVDQDTRRNWWAERCERGGGLPYGHALADLLVACESASTVQPPVACSRLI